MKRVAQLFVLLFVAAGLVIVTTPAMAQQQYPAAPVQNNNGQPQAPTDNGAQYPQAPTTNPDQNTGAVYNQAPVYANSNGQGITIPAGTNLSIRTDQNIQATKSDVGQTFPAEIAQNVMDQNNNVVIPQGSPAVLKIATVSSGTMGVGSEQVALGLQSVTVNGRTYMVNTAPVKESGNRGIGANKRTAEITGGGALLGTVIGALAGGAKGAAIGAVLGAGGGAATQVLTQGNQVKVPAETVLTFHLDQPLQLQ